MSEAVSQKSDDRIEIELLRPFEHHGQTISRVTIKEPTGGLFGKLGEPSIPVRLGNGGGYYVENVDTIRQYLDKCIDHPDGSELIKLMGLADAIFVKNTLLGFFTTAESSIIARLKNSSSSA